MNNAQLPGHRVSGQKILSTLRPTLLGMTGGACQLNVSQRLDRGRHVQLLNAPQHTGVDVGQGIRRDRCFGT
ncbi:hypothetical protein D3C84_1152280 [compost metagenome]